MNISFSALIGFILGLGLFSAAVVFNTDNYLMFLSLSSLAMVVGGTVASAMISYEGRNVLLAFKEILATLVSFKVNPKKLYEDVGVLIDWSLIVRQKGLLRLEKEVDLSGEDKNFLSQSYTYLLSGYKGNKLRLLLANSRDAMYEQKMIVLVKQKRTRYLYTIHTLPETYCRWQYAVFQGCNNAYKPSHPTSCSLL